MKMSLNVKRNRRLRKKLYLDEFAVMGFEMEFGFTDAENDEAFFAFQDQLIDFAESRKLTLFGMTSPEKFHLMATASARYESATEEDRAAFEKWLAEHDQVVEPKMSEIVDANYDFD